MPIPPENLAMVGSDWPGADWNREKSTRLVGPRRGEERRAHTPGGREVPLGMPSVRVPAKLCDSSPLAGTA
jgi:hypothetical protein